MYGISGVMMLVNESPIRYAACVTSSEKPMIMSIGTNTGPTTAHLAETRSKSAPLMDNP